MRNSALLIIVIIFVICLGSCAMPTSYYTNPNSAGYHQQGLGGICERCGNQFQFSGAQLNNLTNITCPYCNHSGDLQQAAARWVNVKQGIQQQQAANLLGAAITGFADGYTGNRSNPSTTNSYSTGGCTSDFNCSVGQKCVKDYYSSSGVCMKSVNEYGIQTFDAPDTKSIGVNMEKGCLVHTDCPVGFRCAYSSGACIKK